MPGLFLFHALWRASFFFQDKDIKFREHVVTLMYDSPARVQEIADIKIKDIRLNTPAVITLHGKGNKTIHVLMLGKVRDLLTGYLEDHKKYSWGIALSDIPVFCNQKNQSLTRWEISFILKRYVEMARKDIGFMVNFPVTPHILRHSKAVGMLKSGINLIYIYQGFSRSLKCFNN